MKLITYSDGASRGNPGQAGAGGVLIDEDGTIVKEISCYLGITTNNIAEYRALIEVLEYAAELHADEIEICADSELLVKQLNREYKVKNEGLKPLFDQVLALLFKYKLVTIKHVYRNENKRADELANYAIDNRDESEGHISSNHTNDNVDECLGHEQGTLF